MQTNSRFFEKAEMRHEDSLMANRIHLLSKSVEELEEQYDERLLAIALLPPLRGRRIDNDEVDGGDDDDFDCLKGAARAGNEAQWRRRQKPLDSLSSGEDTPPPRSATFGRLSVQQRDVMKSRSMEFSGGVRRGVVLVGGSPTLPARVGGRKSMPEAIPPRVVRKCNTCNETELLAVMNDTGRLKGKRSSSGSLSQSSSQEEAATCGGDDTCPPSQNEDPSDYVPPLKNPLLAVPHLMEKGVVKSKSVELRPYGRLQSVPASGSATLQPQSRRNAASTLLPTSGLRGSGGPSPNKFRTVMSLGRNLDSSELDMYSGSEGNLSKSYSLEDGLAETGKEHGKKGWLKRLFSRSAAKFKADV